MVLQLFLSFVKIGAFSFGGGYAAIPLITQEVVESNRWMTGAQLADLIAISQTTPGPIAINAATFIGAQLSGFLGATVATVGVILVPVTVVLLLYFLATAYLHSVWVKGALRGLRTAVVALILYSAYSIGVIAFDNPATVLICLGSVLLLRLKRFHPVGVIVMGALLGLVFV
ncbi:MAG: chromate transporter [Spirochaetaceae bacterium]